MAFATITLTDRAYPPPELTSLFSKPKWPNVEASLDLQCKSLGKTGRPCWFVKGPARAAYLQICYPIRDLLEQRDDWKDGAVKDMPWGFDCFMVGQVARSAARARPTIVVHCRNVDCCHRAIRIIQASELWLAFIRQYPAFQLMSRNRPPRPLAGSLWDSEAALDNVVYGNTQLISRTFATPVYFKVPAAPALVAFRQATMGGTILVGGQARGLTVAHAVHSTLLDLLPHTDDDGEAVETIFHGLQEEQNDSEIDDDVDITSTGSLSFGQQSSGGATSSSGSMANIPYFEGAIFDAEKGTERAAQSDSSPKIGRIEMKPIGIVKYASSNREGVSLDWAVLELDSTSSPQTGLPLKHCVFPDTLTVSEFASPISSSRKVWTMTVTGRIRGYLSATPSFVRLPGHPSAIETNLLHLDGPLHAGDSGSWVIDSDTHALHGHVIAGRQNDCVAYIVHGTSIQGDIETFLSTTVELPSTQQSPQKPRGECQTQIEAHIQATEVAPENPQSPAVQHVADTTPGDLQEPKLPHPTFKIQIQTPTGPRSIEQNFSGEQQYTYVSAGTNMSSSQAPLTSVREGKARPTSNATEFASSDDTQDLEWKVSVNDQRLVGVESSADPMLSAMLRQDDPVGKLKVRIKQARRLRPCPRPYVVCTIEGSHYISDPAELKDAERNAVLEDWHWNCEIEFDIWNSDSQLMISIYDSSERNFLGQLRKGSIVLSKVNGWYPLSGRCHDEDWIVGEVLLEHEYRSGLGKREYGVKDFQLSKLIGKGQTGKVYEVRKCDTNGVYAMKVYPKKGLSQGELVDQRARFGSPFLADVRFAFQDPTNMYCLTDFQPGGELFWYLQQEGRFREDEAKFYTVEIILALRELHRHGFQAVDLKPEKILLSATGHIVLVDFFLAMEDLHGLDTIRNSREPTEYSAPEALLGEKPTNVMDFWSLGVLTFEMSTGWSPFYAEDTKQMHKNIAFGKCRFARDTLSANGRNFIKGLLNRNPWHRLGARRDVEELMEHPFFSGIDWIAFSEQRTIPPLTPRIGSPRSHFSSESNARSWLQDPSSLGSTIAGTLPGGPSMPGTFTGDTLVEHSSLEKYFPYVHEEDSHRKRPRAPSTDPTSRFDTSKREPITDVERDTGVFEHNFEVW